MRNLLRGDCIPIMKTMFSESVDLIFTDVPYSLGYDFENDNLSLDQQADFASEYCKEFYRLLKKDGTLAIFCSQELAHYLYFILEKLGMVWQNEIVWHRGGGQPPKNKLAINHEMILVFTKGSRHKTFNLDQIRIKSKYAASDKRLNPAGKNPGDVWYIPALFGKKKERLIGENGRALHPTQKPEELCRRIITAYSSHGDLVLDSFAGVGTIPFMCQELGREFIGIEIDPTYYNAARERIGIK